MKLENKINLNQYQDLNNKLDLNSRVCLILIKDIKSNALYYRKRKTPEEGMNRLQGFFRKKSWQRPTFTWQSHTIIGAKLFHDRVRDGIGWFQLAQVTKKLKNEQDISAALHYKCLFLK